MALSDYILIEHQSEGGRQIHVKRSRDPNLVVEFEPAYNSVGKLDGGVLKRVRIQNSWTGDYRKYNKFIAEAETFLRKSIESPVPPNRLFG
jgi:hypothetical protein